MLDRILETKRREIDSLPTIDVTTLTPCAGGFKGALARDGLSIIAEVKRRSPSAGRIRENVDSVDQAARYVAGGARAISVLVDATYFAGSWQDLADVSQSVEVPVLCKEFIIDARQVHLARHYGADSCLLMAAALDDDSLGGLIESVRAWSMDALVEIHNERELRRALECGADIIGINNRDLRSMTVDLGTVDTLAPIVPPDRIVVAESGYGSPEAFAGLPNCVDAVLVGTALMKTDDPGATLQTWLRGRDVEGAPR